MLFEVTPLNNGVPVTLRMAAVSASPEGTQLDGYEWLPLIVEQPNRQVNFADGGVLKPIEVSHGGITFWMTPEVGNEDWSAYEWTGATCNVWTGEDGAPFEDYSLYLTGTTSSLSREGINASLELLGPDEQLVTQLLTEEYQGTGGAEGPADIKGKLKPRCFGSPQSVDPVEIDPAHKIYQIDGYGTPLTIAAVYEFAMALDPAEKVGDVASYAALAALTLEPGQWATCDAQGMFRLGATPKNKLSADVVCSADTVGEIVPALLAVAGVPSGRIGDFSAWTQKFSLYVTQQAMVGDVARDVMYQAGGYLIARGNGVWETGDYFADKTPVAISNDGSTLPLVLEVKELNAPPPIYKAKIGYDRCWSVHSDTDVSPALAELSDSVDANAEAVAAAQEQAAIANAAADALELRLDSIESDGVLDRSEKAQVVRDFQVETQDKNRLSAQGSSFNVTAERTAYLAAYTALETYLNGLSPAYTDLTQNTPIVRSAWNTAWSDYLDAKRAFTVALTGRASTTSTWSGTTGDGKPEDYADVTGNHTSNDTANVGGRPAGPLLELVDDAAFVSSQLNRTVDDILVRQAQTASNLHVNIGRVERTTTEKFLVEQTSREELRVSLTDAIGSVSADLVTEKAVRLSQDAALASQLTTLNATVGGVRADLAAELVTRANADSALSASILDLSADIEGVSAALTTEASTRASADSALSSQYTALNASLGTLQAALTTETTARVNADSALTQQYTNLNTSFGTLTSNLATETTARVDGDNALSASITSLTTTANGIRADLTTETSARTSADSALSSSLSTLTARMNNYGGTGSSIEAAIASNASAITAESSARASLSTTLQADYNGKIGTINSTLSTQVSKMGAVENRWTLSLNAGGNAIAGLVLANGSDSKSIFAVQADKFYVFNDSGSGTSPFFVSGGQTFIQNAAIADASITSAKIGSLQVQSANIADLTVGGNKISANAVTNTVAAYTAAGIATVAASWITAQSISINVEGNNPVLLGGFLNYAVDHGGSTASSWNVGFRITRNGTTVYETVGFSVTRSNSSGVDRNWPFGTSLVDTPGAGSYTYAIQFYADERTLPCVYRSIYASEIKK